MQNDVTKAKVRRVIQSQGGAHLISLPVDFVRRTGVGKGDEVIVAWDYSVLVVVPNPERMTNIIRGEPNSNDNKQ